MYISVEYEKKFKALNHAIQRIANVLITTVAGQKRLRRSCRQLLHPIRSICDRHEDKYSAKRSRPTISSSAHILTALGLMKQTAAWRRAMSFLFRSTDGVTCVSFYSTQGKGGEREGGARQDHERAVETTGRGEVERVACKRENNSPTSEA